MDKEVLFKKQTYDEAEKEIASAIDWLKSLGETHGSDRISQYGRIFSNPKENMPLQEYFALHYETSLLVEIFRHFPREQIHVLKEMLPYIFKGPRVQADEKPSGNGSAARNYQYELLLGCRLNKAGLAPRFGGKREDLLFNYLGTDVYVECKRPWSEKGIGDALKDAIRQLRERFQDGKLNQKGIVGLSIDKIANPKSEAKIFSSSDEAFDSMLEYTKELLKPYEKLLLDRREPKLAGLICSFVSPTETENNSGDLYLIKMDTFIPIDYPDSDNFNFVKSLNKYINEKIA